MVFHMIQYCIFSKETVKRETKKISFANPNLEIVSKGERKEEKECNQKAGETRALFRIHLYTNFWQIRLVRLHQSETGMFLLIVKVYTMNYKILVVI